jgi:Lrp/AsnC family leucine-responsive transcriptional regulator
MLSPIAFIALATSNSQHMANLDRIGQRILHELARDGRLSNIELADRVGLSPSACLRRVQELERAGVIQGYRAVLNGRAVGRGFVAYVAVGLSDHSKASQTAFEQAVRDAPEVRECHNITGAIEYLLRVEVADLDAYKVFHTDVLGTQPHVTALTTYVVMDSPKDERG